MTERKSARSTDRFRRKRDAILDASTVIMNQRGVKGLTLADAAAAVGLSTTSVTYYFKRKDDLAAACMMRGIAWLQAAADEVIQKRLTALGGDGGIIAVDPKGDVAWSFNTSGMYRARQVEGGAPVVQIFSDEK